MYTQHFISFLIPKLDAIVSEGAYNREQQLKGAQWQDPLSVKLFGHSHVATYIGISVSLHLHLHQHRS